MRVEMAVSGVNALIIAVSITAPIIYGGHVAYIIQKLNELLHWKSGCNPVHSLGNVTLHYFDSRGRAEPIRLLMEDHLVPYDETKFTDETWSTAMPRGVIMGVYTFGRLPAITTSRNRHLAQSAAVLHYLGRSVGLDCDCNDLARCDMIAAGVEEMRLRQLQIISDPENFVGRRNDYISRELPTLLKYFEKLISGDSINWYFNTGVGDDGPYFASGRQTWVDYLVFDLIENNCDFLEHTKPRVPEGITLDSEALLEMADNCYQLLEKLPHLSIFVNNFKSRPNIAAYLNSGQRIPYSLPFPER